jgi:hypothetical protein
MVEANNASSPKDTKKKSPVSKQSKVIQQLTLTKQLSPTSLHPATIAEAPEDELPNKQEVHQKSD